MDLNSPSVLHTSLPHLSFTDPDITAPQDIPTRPDPVSSSVPGEQLCSPTKVTQAAPLRRSGRHIAPPVKLDL